MTFCSITTASILITHLLGWKRTEEVLQAHSLQKLESQFQMVRSYDQEENHPQAGFAHDSSHPRQSWVPESCYSADLFVSSNQAKEIPNFDSNSENRENKYEHKKKFMTGNKGGNTIQSKFDRVRACTI